MELIKKAKWAYICISAVMILLGFALIIFPKISALTVCYIIGGVITVFGIIKLIGYFSKDLYRLAFQFDLALGIFTLIAGVLILIHPANVVMFMPVIIGVFVIMDGTFKLQTAFDAKRFGMNYWWMILLLAALTCFCGLFLIINPFDGVIALMIILGATLVIDGIQNLCIVLYTVKAVRSAHDDNEVYYVEINKHKAR